MIKFSVIIPTFNNAQELITCCRSVLNQTIQEFEIIVVNDGSNEDYSQFKSISSEIKNLKYIEIENSGGPANPRNIGIREANGEYICFLDSDDTWEPRYLETIISQYSSYDFICTGAIIHKKKVRPEILIPRIKHPFPDSILLKGNPIITSSVSIKKQILTSSNYSFNTSKTFSGVEDLELWLRILKTPGVKFKLIKKPLVNYNVIDQSLSHKNYKQYIKKHELLFDHLNEYIDLRQTEYQNYLNYIISIILIKNDKLIKSLKEIWKINLLSTNGLKLTLKYFLRIIIKRRN